MVGDWVLCLLFLFVLLGGCGNGGVVDVLVLIGYFLEICLVEFYVGKFLLFVWGCLVVCLLVCEV